jgi:pyruvate dehydrogenase E1 component alpha subunit
MGEGVVHECFNLARLWNLPVVFVCESNARPSGTHANSFQAAATLRSLAAVHQIESAQADASDPRAVEETLAALADQTRSRGGPTFLEAQSEPWPGNKTFIPHLPDGPLQLGALPDASSDPILNELRRLRAEGVALDELLAVDAAVQQEVGSAFASAQAAAPAAPEVAAEHVWFDAR